MTAPRLPSARLNHKHLSSLALEQLEPGVSPSRKHQRSCRCTVSVMASMSSERLNRTRLPFTTGISTTSFSYCTALEHLNQSSDLLDVGHCLCTTSSRASPRHELRLRYLVSFRDVRHLSLYHSVYDHNSFRDLLNGRHPFLYCGFISLNCLCRLDSLLDFPGCSAPGSGAVGCTVGVFTTPTNCRILNLERLHCSLLFLDRQLFAWS